jgi:hypothetical protein
MQDALIGSSSRRPHFTGLASLHDLNHRFLDLVGSRAGDWGQCCKLRLPGEAAARVMPLTTIQRAAAASCPYALFDIRFHDADYWKSRLGCAREWHVADESAVQGEIAEFVRLALFYAWHVVSTTRLMAQLVLGMSEHTAAAFRDATLNCLPTLVAGEAANLTARWPQSDVYWCGLLHAASRTDAARLRRVQLSGLQLAAASRLP